MTVKELKEELAKYGPEYDGYEIVHCEADVKVYDNSDYVDVDFNGFRDFILRSVKLDNSARRMRIE